MNSDIKKILIRIGEMSLSQPVCLFELIKPLLLVDGKMALFVSQQGLMMFSSKSDAREARKDWLVLIELLYIINTLSQEGLIVLFKPDELLRDDWVYYDKATEFSNDQFEKKWRLGDGIYLVLDRDYQITDGNKILYGHTIDHSISTSLLEILCSTMCPTIEFDDYVKRNFKTPSQYSLSIARQGNRIALVAVFIAIAIAVLSPYIQNKYVSTTLNNTQFDRLIDVVSPKSKISTDSAERQHVFRFPIQLEKNVQGQ